MDRGTLAGRPVKLAEAASLSDDPWYAKTLDEATRELARRTREVLSVARMHEQRGFGAGLLAWMCEEPWPLPEQAGGWRSGLA